MIKHTVTATNRQDNREVVTEVSTDSGRSHSELRLTGSLKPIASGVVVLAYSNEDLRLLAKSILDTVPSGPKH